MIAAIIWWNSTYVQEAIAHLRSQGEQVPDDLLVHSSPVSWEHVGFSGDFLWEQAAVAARRRRLTVPWQGQRLA